MQTIMAFLSNNKKNLSFYLGGIIVLGFGVNTMKYSAMGSGAWDTVTINIRDFLNLNLGIDWITMGMISFSISFIIMTIVLLYRKKLKFLLMLIPMFLVALSIDFWSLVVFRDAEASNLLMQIISFIVGALLLPLGLTMVVKSTFPAFVFDELMLMFIRITKAKKITYVRLTIEFIGILIGAIFGYLTYYHIDGTFGVVNIGSFILAFSLSPIMTIYYSVLKVTRNS